MEDLFQEYNNSVIKVEAATGEEITSIEELRKYKSKDSLNLLKQSIESLFKINISRILPEVNPVPINVLSRVPSVFKRIM